MSHDEIHLERMTWPDVRAALDAGRRTAVVACGAVEQHGPHLPLFVDAEHGTRLAGEVARRLGDALVAPTIRVGCSDHHLAFPGTISLRRSTLEAVCVDYCASLAYHGFHRICFIPSHAGNFDVLAGMLGTLNEVVEPDAEVVAFTDLFALIGLWKAVAGDAEPGLADRVGGHADVAETAIMLALHPELVRRERAEAGYTGEITPELVDRALRDGFRSITHNGIIGDARGASAEIGELLIRALADTVAEHFREGVAAAGG